jgi:hypothetical protein
VKLTLTKSDKFVLVLLAAIATVVMIVYEVAVANRPAPLPESAYDDALTRRVVERQIQKVLNDQRAAAQDLHPVELAPDGRPVKR